FDVPANHPLHIFFVLGRHRFEFDHLPVDQCRESAFLIEHEGQAAAHAGGKIAARLAQDDGPASGHILAPVVPNAFDDCLGPAVADAESLAGDATQKDLAASRTVEHHIAGDDVIFRDERAFSRRIDDHAATRQALAAIVVHVAFYADRDAM